MDTIRFIAKVRSTLKDLKDCPLQEHEGAPEAYVAVDEQYRDAMTGLQPGDRILLLTWLHAGNRSTLVTKPRNDQNAPDTGVFATRSPDRPNPIGIHNVIITRIDGLHIHVSQLEVIDGTPVVDIKPVI